jgi:hypothetical protein
MSIPIVGCNLLEFIRSEYILIGTVNTDSTPTSEINLTVWTILIEVSYTTGKSGRIPLDDGCTPGTQDGDWVRLVGVIFFSFFYDIAAFDGRLLQYC